MYSITHGLMEAWKFFRKTISSRYLDFSVCEEDRNCKHEICVLRFHSWS